MIVDLPSYEHSQYSPNTDLVPHLQQSLSKLRQHEKKAHHDQPPQMVQSPAQTQGREDVLNDFNSKILKQCRRYLNKDKIFFDEYSTLDIDKEID